MYTSSVGGPTLEVYIVVPDQDKSKPHLNIVFVGRRHGKSTTVGRLLLDNNHIEQHVLKFEQALSEGRPVSVSPTLWTD